MQGGGKCVEKRERKAKLYGIGTDVAGQGINYFRKQTKKKLYGIGTDDGTVGAPLGMPPCGLPLLRTAGGGAARARARTFAAATAAESTLNFVGTAASVDAASTGGNTGTAGRAERAAAAGTAALAWAALAHARSMAGRTARAPTKSSRLPRSTQ